MLQEREGELAQEPVVVQATPASALEMVEPQLVLHLLVHLLADPTSLDQGRQDLERRIGRVIGQVVLPLAAGAMLADQPSLFTRKMLPFGGYRPVGHPDPDGGERGLKRAFGAGTPRDGTERGRPVLDQLSGSHARQRGHRMLARAAGRFALGEGERHIGGIDLLHRQDADRIAEPPLGKPGAELGRFAVLGIRQHAAATCPRRQHAVDLVQRDLPLRAVADGLGHAHGRAPLSVTAPVLRQE